jgi:HNH endonuclease
MSRPVIKTRKRAIAEYWLGTDEGRARLPGNSALIDCGEPSCFACGWMATDPDLEPRIWQVWDHAMLQRCHLIPHSLGGTDAPDNLVLLCARCHIEAPDVADAEYMLRWIDAHESWGVHLMRELDAAIARHAITEREMDEYNSLGIKATLDLHRTVIRRWAVPVGGHFSYATLAACAIKMVRRAAEPHATGQS